MRKNFKSIQSFNSNQTKKYFDFINVCRNEIIPKTVYSEIHHIIPLSHGGTNTPANLIRLTYDNHIKAHKLILEITENLNDSYIVNMMSGQTEETRKMFRQLGSYASHEKQKQLKGEIFTIQFQKEMSQRSLISEKAKQTRKKIGSNLGIKRQKNRIIKYHDRYLLTRNNMSVLCVTHCNTGQDIAKLIASIDPVVYKVMSKSQLRMTRIIKDPTKSLYKWRCVKLHLNKNIIQKSNKDNPQPSQEWVKILSNCIRINSQFLGRFRD